MTYKERQDTLSNFYGFKCSCPFCIFPRDNNILQSDVARSTLASPETESNPEESTFATSSPVLPSFEDWCLDPTLPDNILINAHLRDIQLIEREGSVSGGDHLTRDIVHHLDAIAICYGALEDVDNFRLWMGHVSEARLGKESNTHKPEQQKLVFSKWISNPTLFPAWGWRKVFCTEERDGKDSGDSLKLQ